jgi:hypothetical protein
MRQVMYVHGPAFCRWCERCQQVSQPTWRYVLSVTAQVTVAPARQLCMHPFLDSHVSGPLLSAQVAC